MSLNLYYRECLTGDRKVLNEVPEFNVFEKISKLYLSEDKRFAGMVVGTIPNEDDWKSIRNHIDCFIVESVEDPKKAKKNVMEKLAKVFEDEKSTSSLFFVYGDLVMTYHYEDEFSSFRKHNPSVPYAAGSGKTAAVVLINSELPIDQEEFYRIVSVSDYCVGAEFDLIELKDVIGTPWHTKHKSKAINK